jgi:hypothetical protein
MTTRATIDVDGMPISYLTAGKGGQLLLLLCSAPQAVDSFMRLF